MITAKLRAQINASTLRKNKPPIESSLRKGLKDADSQSRIERNLLNLKISLRCTSERFTAHNCPIRMKISELKSLLEFVCGIPSNIQRLRYLDEGELIDTKDLQYYDIIDGATINMVKMKHVQSKSSLFLLGIFSKKDIAPLTVEIFVSALFYRWRRIRIWRPF
jgi:hypothetical protein